MSFRLSEGVIGVVGENGSGKTTLLGLARGALSPERGSVRIEPSGAAVAYCPQTVDVLGEEVLEFAGRTDGSALSLQDVLGLSPGDIERWSTLSPGERRLWQLAAALHREPDLLLCDEPTNQLDREARGRMERALSGFREAEWTSTTCPIHGRRQRGSLWPARERESARHEKERTWPRRSGSPRRRQVRGRARRRGHPCIRRCAGARSLPVRGVRAGDEEPCLAARRRGRHGGETRARPRRAAACRAEIARPRRGSQRAGKSTLVRALVETSTLPGERLEAALEAYPGALVVVSHDDRFAGRLTLETWSLGAGS